MFKSACRRVKRAIKRKLDRGVSRGTLSIKKISKHTQVVSFDIFDTLIVRDVDQPTDVFKLMSEKSGISDFPEKRIEAEKRAREQSSNGEVKLADIYAAFEGMPNDQIQYFCDLELSTELSLCHASIDGLRFFTECKTKFRVVLVSDMYLTSEMLEKILGECGIQGYEKLYVSCEVGKSKGSKGALYNYVAEDLGIRPNMITHIGNDFVTDYWKAKRKGIKAIKIKTCPQRIISSVTCPKNIDNTEELHSSLIYHFINNTTHDQGNDYDFYYRFGYENFGILLWGFNKWLFESMKNDGIEQVLFVARDGYMLKSAYDKMCFNATIPSYYFEMSRRSVGVSSFLSRNLSYEEMLTHLSLPSRTGVNQIIDTWGLSFESCLDALESCEISKEEVFWTKNLAANTKVRQLYETLRQAITENAKNESKTMLEYVKQFNLEKKTAFVDIGYGATIQKDLISALADAGIEADIYGYYIGLDKRARLCGEEIRLNPKGYVWDNYNEDGDLMEEKPFSGFFETLFLENSGSVKKYIVKGDKVVAERYPYEYSVPGGLLDEVALVRRIQHGAMDFIETIRDFYVGEQLLISGANSFRFLRNCMLEPSSEILNKFGSFRFFNLGGQTYLAKPKRCLAGYCLHPKQMMADFYESQWKTGFLKALLKVRISYEKLWRVLKGRFKSAPVKE